MIPSQWSLKPRMAPLQALMNSLRAGIIGARVAVAVELFPGVLVAPFMIGTLAASGGKLCVDSIMQLVGPKPSGAGMRHPSHPFDPIPWMCSFGLSW